MNEPVALILALVLVVAVLLPQGPKRTETYEGKAELTEVRVDPTVADALNRSLVFVVVSGYLEALENIKRAKQVKPLCTPLLKTGRDNVTRSLKDKLAAFKPVTRKALQDAADDIMKVFEDFCLSHCQPELVGPSQPGLVGLYQDFKNSTLKDIDALHRKLKQLSVAFNSGVRA